jgi:hypothetical protein
MPSRSEIPKTIWMLWLQGLENAPWLVQQCVTSWQQQNPNWTVQILSRDNLHQFQPPGITQACWQRLSLQKQANLGRLQLLLNHGGVWADATTLCRKPLDAWIHNQCDQGFFAFANPGPDRPLSNWFLASRPGHPLTEAWLDKQLSYFESQPQAKHRSLLQRGTFRMLEKVCRTSKPLSQLWFHPGIGWLTGGQEPYFIAHYCFTRCVQDNKNLNAIWTKVPKISAEKAHLAKRLHARDQTGLNTTRNLAELMECDAPVYKLCWKSIQTHEGDNGLISQLLATTP